jgi:mRNA-degrading endonuclease RelE of RelBE toxin-antitoxin system
MAGTSKYQVRVTPEAVKQLRRLDAAQRTRVDRALKRLANSGSSSSRGGNSLKMIRGSGDRFFRLRVGQLRVIFDVLRKDRVIHVIAVLDRRDLDRWLRGR